MISLCKDKTKIIEAVNNIEGQDYFKTIIYNYLEAFGTDYSFSEFYLQYSDDVTTAVVYRCDTYIYLINADTSDFDELYLFLSGFSNSVLYCNSNLISVFENAKTCHLMSKAGETHSENSEIIKINNSVKEVTDLITKDMSISERENFFLNIAHLSRHNLLNIYAKKAGDTLVSVAGVTKDYNAVSAIIFVYTDEYFRGNGYSKAILSKACSDDRLKYQLICEEHNLKFYKNCGFSKLDTCLEIRL